MAAQDWLTWTLLFYPLGILAAIDALWSGRTAQGTIAWMLALLALPQISLPAYLLFGSRRLKGYRRARQRTDDSLSHIAERLEHTLLPFRRPPIAAVRPLLALFRSPLLGGNQTQLLTSGEQTFTCLFEHLSRAQLSICLQSYIIRDDHIGQALLDLLCQRAKAGVKVYVLFDEIGSHGLSRRYRQQLKAANIQFSRFNPIHFRNRMQLNFRNHRKLVVVDEHTAFVGGYNIGDEYLRADWRDTHLLIKGPAALSFQLGFSEDWQWATGQLPELHWQPAPAMGKQAVMCINPGPADHWESASLFVCQLIQSAQQRCWLVSPYFVPDQALISHLQLAVLRGVDVRVLLPEKTDNRLVQLAMTRYIEELSQAGIRFSTYRAGFLHQKVILIDQELLSIGSANLDNRSLRINFEMNALVQDKELAQQVESMLQQDFLNATAAQVDSRWWHQLLARLARLLAPLL